MARLPLCRRIVEDLMLPLRQLRNRLYYRCSGGQRRPIFLDAATTCPGLLRIDENFEVIQREMNGILSDCDRFPLYHEVDDRVLAVSAADDKNWRVFFLYLATPYLADGVVPLSNSRLCPRTVEIIRGIPNVISAFFSILEPGKSIPAHADESFTYLRYHTALKVPAKNPPTLRVLNHTYTWKEGESVFFDDSWEHEVYNQSEEARVVLIVDVERPVPWPLRVYSFRGPEAQRARHEPPPVGHQ